ncbi:hypothetical protein C8J57DRAFT_162957 [Mycena rebaudengoi]|nr:hypothetical protein C8J57DRAFT_162957 [Mycena rebaudengoi]
MKRQPNAVLAWVSNLKLVATTLRVTSAAVPVPGLQAVFEGAVMILDLVERVGKNDTDLKYLAESVINITSLLNDELRSRPNGADNRLEKLCKDYIRYLDNVAEELHKVLAPKPKFWFKKYLKERSIRNNLDEFTRKLTDLRADLTLAAAIGSNFQITDTHQRVRELHSAFSRVSSEEDIRVFKPSELWLDFETVNVGVVSLREDPPGSAKADQVLVRSYLAKVGEAKATTVRIYEGARASQMWKWDLDMFSANLRVPGVAQIYGMCTSPRFKALIFHDGASLIYTLGEIVCNHAAQNSYPSMFMRRALFPR